MRDSRAYAGRGILASVILEATTPLDEVEDVLYRSVYTLFAAMPWRLVPGSRLLIHTADVPGGVELTWEAREEAGAEEGGVHTALAAGPHGDLVEIAFHALERFCAARAGETETRLTELPRAGYMPPRPVLLRRVRVMIPAAPQPAEPLSPADTLSQA